MPLIRSSRQLGWRARSVTRASGSSCPPSRAWRVGVIRARGHADPRPRAPPEVQPHLPGVTRRARRSAACGQGSSEPGGAEPRRWPHSAVVHAEPALAQKVRSVRDLARAVAAPRGERGLQLLELRPVGEQPADQVHQPRPRSGSRGHAAHLRREPGLEGLPVREVADLVRKPGFPDRALEVVERGPERAVVVLVNRNRRCVASMVTWMPRMRVPPRWISAAWIRPARAGIERNSPWMTGDARRSGGGRRRGTPVAADDAGNRIQRRTGMPVRVGRRASDGQHGAS